MSCCCTCRNFKRNPDGDFYGVCYGFSEVPQVTEDEFCRLFESKTDTLCHMEIAAPVLAAVGGDEN